MPSGISFPPWGWGLRSGGQPGRVSQASAQASVVKRSRNLLCPDAVLCRHQADASVPTVPFPPAQETPIPRERGQEALALEPGFRRQLPGWLEHRTASLGSVTAPSVRAWVVGAASPAAP